MLGMARLALVLHRPTRQSTCAYPGLSTTICVPSGLSGSGDNNDADGREVLAERHWKFTAGPFAIFGRTSIAKESTYLGHARRSARP
jgi:hypothetical protein